LQAARDDLNRPRYAINSIARSAIILGLVAALGAGSITLAGGARCAHCGCSGPCEKVCRLVCEDKKVTVTCWGYACEEFCDPGPSARGCRHCEEVCGPSDEKSGAKAPCSQPKTFVWHEWIPGCVKHIYTKKKLMKKTVTKTVPGFKWVVEDLCPECEQKAEEAEVRPDDKVPPPPAVDAKLKGGRRAGD
jgi:hypothetical protein